MSTRNKTALAWLLWTLSVLLLIGYIALRVAVSIASSPTETSIILDSIEQTQMPRFDFLGEIFLHIGYLAFSTLGVLMVARHPENRMGWIFCAIGFIQAVSEFATYYAIYALVIAPGSLPGGLAAGWLQNWLIALTTGLLVIFLPLLFPNGRLLSHRWRTVGWLGAGTIAVVSFCLAFYPSLITNTALAVLSNPLEALNNPLGIKVLGELKVVAWIVNGLFFTIVLAAATSLILRLRQATGDERLQIKWFAYIATLLVLVYALGLPTKMLYLLIPSFEVTGRIALVVWRIVIVFIAFVGLPLAAGLAILKYRLYDIDIIINRTLVYGALTASVVGLYILIVGGLGTLLQTQSNLPATIIAILIVAFLFQPLWRRLQNIVNRFMPVPQAIIRESIDTPAPSINHEQKVAVSDSESVPVIPLRGACLAWAMWGLSLALIAVGSVLHLENEPNELWSYLTNDLLVILPFATVGALIASRRPDHPIGWMFCAGTSLLALEAPTAEYAIHALVTAPGSLPGGLGVAWFASWYVILIMGFLLSFVLLFPTGRLPSPRWRPVLWLWISYLVLAVLTWAFKPGPLPAFPTVNNPLGIERAATILKTLTDLLSGPLFLTFWAAFIFSVITRFRRADGEERQQLKWFAYACSLIIVWAGAYTLFQFLHIPLSQSFISLLWGLAFAGLPVSVGIAILKYRLYDIDIIINRTLVYGAMIVIVLGLYVLVVGMAGMLFQSVGNSLVAILATGLIAVLFQPLRQRLQRSINHLMYGERDEPYAALSRLGRRLESTLAPEAVLPTVVTTVREVLKLPYVAIYLKQDHDGNKIVAESASPVLRAEDGRIRVPGMDREGLCIPLIHQGETLGYIVLGPRAPNEAFSSTDLRLLDDLAPQVGVAVHAVRLTADLQRSRERLVMAREEERRRLRRDLHDGLGPQLAGLTLKLETARNRLTDDPLADSLLADLAKRTQDATADIRRLVYELRPPTLDELGLVSALREGAGQYSQQGLNGVHITIDAPEDLPPLPAAVEVAVYRITLEALTNVVHHAGAHVCNVRITLDEQISWLCLEIHDDGRGLSLTRRAGIGLNSMRERAEELGGTWTIESLPTGGTRILVRLPCRLPDHIDSEKE